MIAEVVGLISQPPIALPLAGVFLVTGFLVTRLAFRKNPVARFLCQLASFGGFTIMLLAAGVLPSEPTPREGPDFAFVVTIVFKIVWWDAASGCDPKWCNQAVRRSDLFGLLSLAAAARCRVRAFQ